MKSHLFYKNNYCLKLTLLLAAFFTLNFATAQNLVPNPSFEEYTTCPVGVSGDCVVSEVDKLTHWFLPTCGSSDVYNLCASNLPNWPFFGHQLPRNGNGFVGFITMFDPNAPDGDYREYLSVPLTQTLTAGVEYCVSAYVSTPEMFNCLSDKFGFLFTDTIEVDFNNYTTINQTPQVEHVRPLIPDTINWVQVGGSFVANGTEKYLTIGNFNDDANTNSDCLFTASSLPYYYIDDVRVEDCSTVSVPTLERSNTLSIYPNPASDYFVIEENQLPLSNTNVSICDLQGKTIGRFVTDTDGAISLDGIKPGIYFVFVNAEEQPTLARKLVIR